MENDLKIEEYTNVITVDSLNPWSELSTPLPSSNELDIQRLAIGIFEQRPTTSYFLTLNPQDQVPCSNTKCWMDMFYKQQYNSNYIFSLK